MGDGAKVRCSLPPCLLVLALSLWSGATVGAGWWALGHGRAGALQVRHPCQCDEGTVSVQSPPALISQYPIEIEVSVSSSK